MPGCEMSMGKMGLSYELIRIDRIDSGFSLYTRAGIPLRSPGAPKRD